MIGIESMSESLANEASGAATAAAAAVLSRSRRVRLVMLGSVSAFGNWRSAFGKNDIISIHDPRFTPQSPPTAVGGTDLQADMSLATASTAGLPPRTWRQWWRELPGYWRIVARAA